MTLNSTTKFIHASDLHLGSRQYSQSVRSDDYIYALKEILHHAVDFSVDFVLLGGDVFNSLDILPGKMAKIIEILKKFNHITSGKVPIISIEGNHDIRRYSRGVKFNHSNQSWLKVCAKMGLMILLDADLQADSDQIFRSYDFDQGIGGKIQIKNIVVYGSRYLGEKPVSLLSVIRKAIRKEKGIFNILLQHFGVKGQMINVPGVPLEILSPLHHRIDYLALGHYHKQFVIDNWIYNPGSAEAVCAMDYHFKRGIFLVEINESDKNKKNVQMIPLKNRNHLSKNLIIPYQFRRKENFFSYIVNSLKNSHDWTFYSKDKKMSKKMPFLLLILRGRSPFLYREIPIKALEKFLVNELPVVSVKIYQKFNSNIPTIENYL